MRDLSAPPKLTQLTFADLRRASPPATLRREQLANDVHTDLTPSFNILCNGGYAGFISRGHATIISEYRGTQVFPQALSQLEQYESELFRAGRFEEYKREIIRGMGRGADIAAQTVFRLRTPHHIDFWRLPSPAASYLKFGYTLDFQTRLYLTHRGFCNRDATIEQLAEALRTHHTELKGFILCVLTKPWDPK